MKKKNQIEKTKLNDNEINSLNILLYTTDHERC